MSTFVCEIEIKEQNPPNWCSITHSHSDQPAITVLFHSTSGFFRRYCSAFTLATFWEILFASFASLITSSYTLQHEDQVSSPNLFFRSIEWCWLTNHQGFNFARFSENISSETFGLQSLDFLVDPSPALMLACCLILGCSISSFVYRRQEHDLFQTPVFFLITGIAVTIGVGLRVHSNIIMLALIPWALCFAMITSALGHWVFKNCGRQRPRVFYGIDEKEILIRKFWTFVCCDQFGTGKQTLSKCNQRLYIAVHLTMQRSSSRRPWTSVLVEESYTTILSLDFLDPRKPSRWEIFIIPLPSRLTKFIPFSQPAKLRVLLSRDQHLIRFAAQFVFLHITAVPRRNIPWWPVLSRSTKPTPKTKFSACQYWRLSFKTFVFVFNYMIYGPVGHL